MKQVELINLIDCNPHRFKVFFLEVGILQGIDFIFVDKLSSQNIYGDGKFLFAYTSILISAYSTNNKILQETISYLREHFNGEVVYEKEDEYYKATLRANVMVDEWQ